MDKLKTLRAVAMAGGLVVAGLAGAAVHDISTEPQLIEVPVIVETQLPGQVQIVEVPKEVIVEKIVTVENPETAEKLETLETAFERVTGETIDYEMLVFEDVAIANAQVLFLDRVERLLDLEFDEEVEVLKMFDASAEVNPDAHRVIDGKLHEVFVAEAQFTARVKVTDSDGNSEVREYLVEYEQDWESDGDKDEIVEVTLL